MGLLSLLAQKVKKSKFGEELTNNEKIEKQKYMSNDFNI